MSPFLILVAAVALILFIAFLKLIFRGRRTATASYARRYQPDLRFPGNGTSSFRNKFIPATGINDTAAKMRKEVYAATEANRRWLQQIRDQNERTRKINEDIRKRGDLVRKQNDDIIRNTHNILKRSRGW